MLNIFQRWVSENAAHLKSSEPCLRVSLFKRLTVRTITVVETVLNSTMDKCVSTIPDECKGVGLEISANSKRRTFLIKNEDIVSAFGNKRLYVQNFKRL